jgi:hypothetical protein
MERFAYLYVLDTLSDWEPGYAIAELHSGRYFKEPGRRVPVRTVGVGTQPVTTMGGVEITPEVLVSDVSPENTAVLLPAGADTWGEPQHDAVLHKAEELLEAGANVAAICGATGASPMPVFSTIARTRAIARSTSRWSPRTTGARPTTWTPVPWPTAT